METKEAPKLIPLAEAARIANVSRVHVWRLVRRGVIPGYQVGEGGGPLRVDRDEFETWLYGNSDPKEAA